MPNTTAPAENAGNKNQKTSHQNGNTSIEQLLKENLELTREIHEHTRKTRRYLLFAQILNVIKVILIVGPIILAILYLPPLIRQALGMYTELIGGGTGQTLLEGGSFVEKLFDRTQ